MALYYFDVHDGETVYADDVGIPCVNLGEVRYKAVDALPDIARDELPDGEDRTFQVRVRDEAGTLVFICCLRFSMAWP